MLDINSNLNVFDTFNMGIQFNLIPSLLMKLNEHAGCPSFYPDAEYPYGAANASGNSATSVEAITEMISECRFVIQYMENSEKTFFYQFSSYFSLFFRAILLQKKEESASTTLETHLTEV
jgi:hypothetical protein